MKSTGIVRKLDELGRVVIPKEIRNKLDIEEKDPIEVYIDGNSIVSIPVILVLIFPFLNFDA